MILYVFLLFLLLFLILKVTRSILVSQLKKILPNLLEDCQFEEGKSFFSLMIFKGENEFFKADIQNFRFGINIFSPLNLVSKPLFSLKCDKLYFSLKKQYTLKKKSKECEDSRSKRVSFIIWALKKICLYIIMLIVKKVEIEINNLDILILNQFEVKVQKINQLFKHILNKEINNELQIDNIFLLLKNEPIFRIPQIRFSFFSDFSILMTKLTQIKFTNELIRLYLKNGKSVFEIKKILFFDSCISTNSENSNKPISTIEIMPIHIIQPAVSSFFLKGNIDLTIKTIEGGFDKSLKFLELSIKNDNFLIGKIDNLALSPFKVVSISKIFIELNLPFLIDVCSLIQIFYKNKKKVAKKINENTFPFVKCEFLRFKLNISDNHKFDLVFLKGFIFETTNKFYIEKLNCQVMTFENRKYELFLSERINIKIIDTLTYSVDISTFFLFLNPNYYLISFMKTVSKTFSYLSLIVKGPDNYKQLEDEPPFPFKFKFMMKKAKILIYKGDFLSKVDKSNVAKRMTSDQFQIRINQAMKKLYSLNKNCNNNNNNNNIINNNNNNNNYLNSIEVLQAQTNKQNIMNISSSIMDINPVDKEHYNKVCQEMRFKLFKRILNKVNIHETEKCSKKSTTFNFNNLCVGIDGRFVADLNEMYQKASECKTEIINQLFNNDSILENKFDSDNMKEKVEILKQFCFKLFIKCDQLRVQYCLAGMNMVCDFSVVNNWSISSEVFIFNKKPSKLSETFINELTLNKQKIKIPMSSVEPLIILKDFASNIYRVVFNIHPSHILLFQREVMFYISRITQKIISFPKLNIIDIYRIIIQLFGKFTFKSLKFNLFGNTSNNSIIDELAINNGDERKASDVNNSNVLMSLCFRDFIFNVEPLNFNIMFNKLNLFLKGDRKKLFASFPFSQVSVVMTSTNEHNLSKLEKEPIFIGSDSTKILNNKFDPYENFRSDQIDMEITINFNKNHSNIFNGKHMDNEINNTGTNKTKISNFYLDSQSSFDSIPKENDENIKLDFDFNEFLSLKTNREKHHKSKKENNSNDSSEYSNNSERNYNSLSIGSKSKNKSKISKILINFELIKEILKIFVQDPKFVLIKPEVPELFRKLPIITNHFNDPTKKIENNMSIIFKGNCQQFDFPTLSINYKENQIEIDILKVKFDFGEKCKNISFAGINAFFQNPSNIKMGILNFGLIEGSLFKGFSCFKIDSFILDILDVSLINFLSNMFMEMKLKTPKKVFTPSLDPKSELEYLFRIYDATTLQITLKRAKVQIIPVSTSYPPSLCFKGLILENRVSSQIEGKMNILTFDDFIIQILSENNCPFFKVNDLKVNLISSKNRLFVIGELENGMEMNIQSDAIRLIAAKLLPNLPKFEEVFRIIHNHRSKQNSKQSQNNISFNDGENLGFGLHLKACITGKIIVRLIGENNEKIATLSSKNILFDRVVNEDESMTQYITVTELEVTNDLCVLSNSSSSSSVNSKLTSNSNSNENLNSIDNKDENSNTNKKYSVALTSLENLLNDNNNNNNMNMNMNVNNNEVISIDNKTNNIYKVKNNRKPLIQITIQKHQKIKKLPFFDLVSIEIQPIVLNLTKTLIEKLSDNFRIFNEFNIFDFEQFMKDTNEKEREILENELDEELQSQEKLFSRSSRNIENSGNGSEESDSIFGYYEVIEVLPLKLRMSYLTDNIIFRALENRELNVPNITITDLLGSKEKILQLVKKKLTLAIIYSIRTLVFGKKS